MTSQRRLDESSLSPTTSGLVSPAPSGVSGSTIGPGAIHLVGLPFYKELAGRMHTLILSCLSFLRKLSLPRREWWYAICLILSVVFFTVFSIYPILSVVVLFTVYVIYPILSVVLFTVYAIYPIFSIILFTVYAIYRILFIF